MSIQTLFEQVEEIAKLGSFETDLTNGIWKGSKQFIKIFGLPPKDHYTVEEFQALVHPEDFVEIMHYFKNCLESSDTFDCEYRAIKSDGSTMYISSRSKIIRDENGNPVRVVGTKQDITERKKVENNLYILNEQNVKKSEVLGTVAHDLRSPLAQIKSVHNMLLREPESYPELLKFLDEAVDTALKITDDLIEMAKLTVSDPRLIAENENINDIVKKSVNHFRFKAEQKDITITTSLCSSAQAEVNAIKFSRIIDNLLSNAIKFTKPGGSVYVSTSSEKDIVSISIEDTGLGIRNEDIPNLFDKFSKLRKTGTTGEKSTGLGLSIVKELVKMHNGKILVTSEVDKGTKFVVEIPRVADEEPKEKIKTVLVE